MISLLDKHAQQKKTDSVQIVTNADVEDKKTAQQLEEERRLLENVAKNTALMGAKEIATGVSYEQSLRFAV